MTERAFSVRALAVGAVVGAVAAVSNVYVSLKTGWSLPVMSTAAIVGLAVARGQRRALAAREAVVLSSVASAAGYMAGGGNVAALPAFVILGGATPSAPALAVWFLAIALLGTFVAPLLGDRLVRELPFPTATATATILTASEAGEAGAREARSLRGSAIASAAFAIARAAFRVPATVRIPGALGAYTLGLDTSLLLAGVGGLMSARTALSTLAGGLLTYAVAAPALVAHGVIAEASYREIVRFMVWPAASLLVAAAIVELGLDLPRLLRTRGERTERTSLVVPGLLGVVTVVLESALFGIPLGWALLSLPAALAFAWVAARSMGETDVVPTKALAPLAQLGFGLSPALATAAMVPNVTSGVALQAADSLGTLKLARLLGTPPREALRARVIGCLLGAVVVVLAYRAIVPDALALPSKELPAPAVLVWKSVLEVVASGSLPSATRMAIGIGGSVGAILALIARRVPAAPSAMGLASGMVLPGSSGVAIALGGLVRMALDRRGSLGPATAAGVVAGESIVGLVLQVWR